MRPSSILGWNLFVTIQNRIGVLPRSDASLSQSGFFLIYNPVAEIRVVWEPDIDVAFAAALISDVVTQELIVTLNVVQAPIFQFLGHNQQPVQNAGVNVRCLEVTSGSSNGVEVVLPLPRSASGTNSYGIVSLEGVTLKITQPGTYFFSVSSAGGGIAHTRTFTVQKAVDVPLGERMRTVALLLLAAFSPILLASVPYSSFMYQLASVASSCILTVCMMAWFSGDWSRSELDPFLRFYAVFICCYSVVLCCGTIALVATQWYSRAHPKFRILTGKRKHSNSSST